MSESEIQKLISDICENALTASRKLATIPSARKDAALMRMANLLDSDAVQQSLILQNKKDLEGAQANGLSSAMIDRLTLTPERVRKMSAGVRQIVSLEDPVGQVIDTFKHATKGFPIQKTRVPIGVIGIIYESRPNVTIDCAALCLKSGNATILRGGREAFHTNNALASVIEEALKAEGLPPQSVQLIPTTDRYALSILLKKDDYVHCLIPRGGENLIRFVAENARMPVIKHYKGVCNLYLDADLDKEMAQSIAVNAKVQRPGVCNAIENLVVHQSLLNSAFPFIAKALHHEGVELRVDEKAGDCLKSFGGIPYTDVTADDFSTEYLDKIISIKTVTGIEEAVDFINAFGSGHSDSIVSSNEGNAQLFLNAVDSATVYWNASTRFTDGFEFGMGAEIGISTDKLHARGPMGLVELTSYKFVITGNGEIRN